eukprot:symbB.v1.2.035158.t1/scaffold4674.1/size36665/2
MWYTLLTATALQLVVAQSTDTCAAHQCLPEEVVGDDQASPAIGLMQTFLKYRLRQERHVVSNLESERDPPILNLTFAGVEPLNPYRLRSIAGACPLSKDLGVEVPLSIGSAAKLQAFQALGFIRTLPHCGLTMNTMNSITELISPGETLFQRNRLAKNLGLAWAVISVTLMMWSFISVALVPRKGTAAVKTSLADDQKAYSSGLLHYISLGWVDELVGRYGKCTHAVIDDNEIISNRRDDNFEPYVKFKHHWEEEVKKAGSVDKAWITRALYRTVGWKGFVVMIILALVEQFSGTIFMVFGLNLFLTSLEDHDVFQQQHPGEPADYLTPTIMILLFIWGGPLLFRASSIVATLVEGHYTQICASGLASVVFDKALRTPAGTVKAEQTKEVDDEEPDPMGQHKPNLVQILNVDIVDCWGGLLADAFRTLTAPFAAIALLVMMIHQIGDSSATVGASYVLPVMLLTVMATGIAMRYWRRYQVCLDKRMKWLTETLISIRTIKALAWERLSYEKLYQAREGEINNCKYMLFISGFMTSIAHTLPWGVLLITIWFAEKQGSVPAHQVMIIQRLIGALLGSVSQVTNGISRLFTVPNSMNRIKRFLAQPDRPKDVVRQPALQNQNAPALRVMGSFTFGGTKPALKHLDVAIPKGELVGVIGRVGSGKTTFLQTIIGELYPLPPYVYSFMTLINPCFGLVCATLLLREATALRRPNSDLPWESEDDQLTHAMALACRKLQKRQDPAIHLNHFQLPTSVLSISSNASRITVVSVCYPQNTDYATICRVAHENFQRYCQDHGYQLIFHNTAPSGLAGRDAAWGKVLALQAALSQPNVDYVFWMDGDSLFMNQDRSLEELIPSGENQLTMAGDHNCFLNSGHLMLKKGNWTENFLNQTWAMYPPPEPKAWWEQSSMIYLLSGLSPEDKDARGCKADVNSCCSSTPGKGCDVRPQRQMNSYLSSFGSGDFILHFAGEGGEKATLMEQYAQRVLPPAPTEAALAQLDQFHTTLHEAAREFLPD